jgi:hypothetical protein
MKKREGELEDGAQVSALVPGTVGQKRQLHLHHIHRHITLRLQMDPVNALTISGGALLMSVAGSLGVHSNKGHSKERNNLSWVKPTS